MVTATETAIRCEWEGPEDYRYVNVWLPDAKGGPHLVMSGGGYGQTLITMANMSDADLHAVVLSFTGEIAKRNQAAADAQERQAREAGG
jgi:hypothetical protein